MKETSLAEFEYIETCCGYKLTRPAFFYIGINPPSEVTHGSCSLSVSGWLFCDSGTEWNGADVVFDTITNIRGSLPHDKIIEMVRADKLERSLINKVKNDYTLIRLSIEDGMRAFRALYHFIGVFINPWHKKGPIHG